MQALLSTFSHENLFNAIQILLDTGISHYQDNLPTLSGQFKVAANQPQIMARLSLQKQGSHWAFAEGYCSCYQKRCQHLAALALEYSAKDQLARAKPAQKRKTATLIRLLRSEMARHHDPFPTMAKHRILYLLSPGPKGLQLTFHKGYLQRDGQYQIKSLLDLKVIKKGPNPKYMSQSDISLLALFDPYIDLNTMTVALDKFTMTDADYEVLFSTHRCIWQDEAAQPLTVDYMLQQDFIDRDYMVNINDRICIDVAANNAVFSNTRLPISSETFDDIWQPKLTISHQHLDFDWLDEPLMAFDVAKFSLLCGAKAVEFEQAYVSFYEDDEWLSTLAAYQLELNAMPLLTTVYEARVWQAFPLGSRLMSSDLTEQLIQLRMLSLKGWCIEFEAQRRFKQAQADSWFATVTSLSKTDNRFSLLLGVEVDGQQVNLLPLIVRAIRQRKLIELNQELTSDLPSDESTGAPAPINLVLELDSGEELNIPGERIANIVAVLDELYQANPLNSQDQLELSRHQLGKLNEINQVIEAGDEDGTVDKLHWRGDTWLKNLANQLDEEVSPEHTEYIAPIGLQATLRDYQKQGAMWLSFLRKQQFNAILADDMGLGKTLQTLAVILAEKEQGNLTVPVLIVAPTSLLTNWHLEAQKFAPSLDTRIWRGRSRHDEQHMLTDSDIVITSYGLLAQDFDKLRHHKFDTLVLDEAQTIKNSRSRITKLVNGLQTQHKLCLTGTPMENHLGELWSLFNFLMPGFLGTASQFKRKFKLPIEQDHAVLVQEMLRKRIKPFMLRRTKLQVATELPQKTVMNVTLTLSQTQAQLYESVRAVMEKRIQAVVQESGFKHNRLAVSNALLRLRQICCDPQLLGLSHQVDPTDELQGKSAKMTWLRDKIPSMIEEGRKILIFSSFTTMLDKIAAELDDIKVDYLQLTGKTRNRDSLIERFQQGDVPIFLISLKAGGAGLNLTTADVVIHSDPWWNPAAEEQASDRAYRIGQTKPVFVYKLICKDTVEERIQALQQTKMHLASGIYQDENLPSTQMGSDEWLTLLAPMSDNER
ncbi:DEAD/DEAH box helicase [Shewanella waksmanii]|uniref:DEAD/DEAH box helicase n=1 Tax=Shewanella waksmanii TaxID=213783 RepID=UPI0004B53FE8|nr:DEAD/DEAH box helicase [Shewanella waksmanii]